MTLLLPQDLRQEYKYGILFGAAKLHQQSLVDYLVGS